MEFSFLSNQEDQLKSNGLQAKPSLAKPFNQSLLANRPTIQKQGPISSVFSTAAQKQPTTKSIFQKHNHNEEDNYDEPEDAIKTLLRQSQQTYQQRVADETSKVIADNPLAYEYDTLYDEEKERKEGQIALKKSQRQNLKSRYINDLVLATERRTREQNAAWENMEKIERIREVETGQVKATAESFITESYRRQLELNQQNKLVEQIEENLNERKTANAETGMMGFYNNYLTKTIEGAVSHNKREEVQQKKEVQTTREKLEDKLKVIKQKQEENERQEQKRRQQEGYDDDPFQIKKADKEKSKMMMDVKEAEERKRSRSRQVEQERRQLKEAEEDRKAKEAREKEAKLKALKDRFKQRKSNIVEGSKQESQEDE